MIVRLFKIIDRTCWDPYHAEMAYNAIELLKENETVCLFTTDKEKSYFSKIFASVYLNMDLKKISENKLTDEEKERVEQVEQKLNTNFDGRLYIFDDMCPSFSHIKHLLTDLKFENKKPDWVFIDNVTNIDFYGKLEAFHDRLFDLFVKFDLNLVAYQEKGMKEALEQMDI